MPYPTIDAPYGYKPVNLIGGQVFAGSTRMYPIVYGYNVNLFYGDPVTLAASGAYLGGIATQASAVNTTNTIVGIFLGCSFTNPLTKQKQFSQYWPAGTLAGDAVAYVADDPDMVIRTAVVTGAAVQTLGSATRLLINQNLAGTTLTTAGSTATGNGVSGVVSAIGNTAAAGFRVLELVTDTQITTPCTYSSGGAPAGTSVVVSGLTVGSTIPLGTDIYNVVGGQLQFTGASVNASTAITSATAQTLNTTAFGVQAAGTLALVQTPEVLVKLNFGAHRYYVTG